MDLQLRPGFNLDTSFKGHLSTVRLVVYNSSSSQFLSADDKCLKAWSTYGMGNIKVHADAQFPSYQSCYVNCMCISSELDLVFAACLDGFLRLYNHHLQISSMMPWSNGVVKEICYNATRRELITAGSYGVKIWECEMDIEAYKADEELDPYDMPRMKDGKYLPWCFGKHQHAKLRVQIDVPGARQVSGRPEVVSGGSNWSDKISLNENSQTLFVLFQASVFGFEVNSGTMVYCFPNLSNSPITSFLYIPDSQTLITTVADAPATVWRMTGTGSSCKLQRFKQLGKTSSPTLHIAADEGLHSIVTCAADGGVTYWGASTLEPIYRMKLARVPPAPPVFYGPYKFALLVESEVKLFSVLNLYDTWTECNSTPVMLQQLGFGLILAAFADSSIRIMDAGSKNTDKSVMTTTPQLSAYNLVAVTCSLACASLFTLLSNGHVHVWELHLKKPPVFKEAWTHLARERCTSITFLEGAGVSPAIVSSLSLAQDRRAGIVHDHVFMGTASGDCLICNIAHGGSVIFRFPAFKHQPLQCITYNVDRAALITSSKASVKIWSLQDVKCVHNLATTFPVTKLEVLQGQLVVGTASGSIHCVDIKTGGTHGASSTSDHMDMVTGIGPNEYLQHFVTCSKDSYLKVFDRNKVFKRSIYIGAPLSCCAYLNDSGDLIAGIGNRIVRVKSSRYEFVLSDHDDSTVPESIYASMRGKGPKHRLGPPVHATRSRMDNPFPAQAPALGRLSSPFSGDRMTPPPAASAIPGAIQKPSNRPSSSRYQAAGTPLSDGVEGKPTLKRTNTLVAAIQAAKAGIPLPLPKAKKPDDKKNEKPKPFPGMMTVPPPGYKGKAPTPEGSHSVRESSLATPSQRTVSPPHHLSTPGSLRMGSPMGFRGSSPLGPHRSSASRSPSPPQRRSPVRTPSPLCKTCSAIDRLRATPTRKTPTRSPDNASIAHQSSLGCSSSGGGRKGGDSDGDGPSSTDAGDSSAASDSDANNESEAESKANAGSGEETNGGLRRTVSELMLESQQRDALVELAAYAKFQVPQTLFKMDLAREAERRERRINGLASVTPLEQRDSHKTLSGIPGMYADGRAGPANMVLGPDGQPMLHIGTLLVAAGSDDDDYDGASAFGASAAKAAKAGNLTYGAARAKRLSPGAQALADLFSEAGKGLAPAFRRALPVICSDVAFLDDLPPELAAQLRELTSTTAKRKKKKKPVPMDLDSMLGDGEMRKKKKKKKRRKKKKGSCQSTDPFKSLAAKTREDSIRIELRAYEQHDEQTKPSKSFLPRIAVAKRFPTLDKEESKTDVSEDPCEPPDASKLLRNFKDGWKPTREMSDQEQLSSLLSMMSRKSVVHTSAGEEVAEGDIEAQPQEQDQALVSAHAHAHAYEHAHAQEGGHERDSHSRGSLPSLTSNMSAYSNRMHQPEDSNASQASVPYRIPKNRVLTGRENNALIQSALASLGPGGLGKPAQHKTTTYAG